MLWQIGVIFILVWILRIQWKRRDLRKISKSIKSDFPTLPLLGDAHHFMGGGEVRMDVLQSIGRQGIKYGGWSSLWLGSSYFGCVVDAVEAEYVMKTHLEKNDLLKVSRGLLGNGLIFAPVSIWRPRRKILAPTFSQHNLNLFVDIFYKQSSVLVENLKEKINQKPFSMWQYLPCYAMDSICETTLGVNMGVQKIQDHIFLRSFKRYAEIISKRLFYPWLTHELGFKVLCYFGMYQEYVKCVGILRKFVYEIIVNKRAEVEKLQKNDPPNNNENGKQKFKPILELLIEASGGEQGYNNKELQEEAQVLLVAGTDTSAVGASFVTLMMAKYPDIQEKVFKEIQQEIGDGPIKSDDLHRLSYLEAVVKETMRMYPPVPITARKIEKDCVTPGGLRLTAGMGVIIHHWGIQRNPKYWGKDVDEFRPERFFDSPPTHPAAYVPFSYGARNCLGYKYAMMSMMTVTATLVRKYRILPADPELLNKPLKCTYEVMMKDKNNFEVQVETRT